MRKSLRICLQRSSLLPPPILVPLLLLFLRGTVILASALVRFESFNQLLLPWEHYQAIMSTCLLFSALMVSLGLPIPTA